MRRIFIALPLLLTATPVLAQQTDEQLWLQTNGSFTVGEDEKVTLEGIIRFGNAAEGLNHAEAGVLYTHTLPSGIELSFGYRHVEDWNKGVTLPNEERLRQMVMVPLGSGFNGRLRFEQRFNNTAPEIGFRLRPRLGFETPLGTKGLKLFATQEHYFNFNDTDYGQRRGHERMRNAVGLSVPLGGKLRGEVGYLNQYRFGRDGRRDQMDHALTLTLNFNVGDISGAGD
ncbi:DUF2490 domain-containing protein [Sphingomonas sp. AOB5]|uniref:DUF2490 domain-containing protein n=1 Tax=Sphingomonas sp. AOB5 TaxID=3034017 RepID=UPI0023FA0E6E|nr:DUF2490 domain-containing protein [Sphingomonas sp. AOB5]MDF7776735.1 DUF2490 domain-containing protein [Sphingomonas sp. AOB5]